MIRQVTSYKTCCKMFLHKNGVLDKHHHGDYHTGLDYNISLHYVVFIHTNTTV